MKEEHQEEGRECPGTKEKAIKGKTKQIAEYLTDTLESKQIGNRIAELFYHIVNEGEFDELEL